MATITAVAAPDFDPLEGALCGGSWETDWAPQDGDRYEALETDADRRWNGAR